MEGRNPETLCSLYSKISKITCYIFTRVPPSCSKVETQLIEGNMHSESDSAVFMSLSKFLVQVLSQNYIPWPKLYDARNHCASNVNSNRWSVVLVTNFWRESE